MAQGRYHQNKRLNLFHINIFQIKFKYSSFSVMVRTLVLLVIFLLAISKNYSTPLDDYVNKPDPNFSWKLLQTYPSSTYTLYVLNMTSQQWIDGLIVKIEKKSKFMIDVHHFSSFIFITITLVALYDYYSTEGS